jgi:hypothetical protein
MTLMRGVVMKVPRSNYLVVIAIEARQSRLFQRDPGLLRYARNDDLMCLNSGLMEQDTPYGRSVTFVTFRTENRHK